MTHSPQVPDSRPKAEIVRAGTGIGPVEVEGAIAARSTLVPRFASGQPRHRQQEDENLNRSTQAWSHQHSPVCRYLSSHRNSKRILKIATRPFLAAAVIAHRCYHAGRWLIPGQQTYRQRSSSA